GPVPRIPRPPAVYSSFGPKSATRNSVRVSARLEVPLGLAATGSSPLLNSPSRSDTPARRCRRGHDGLAARSNGGRLDVKQAHPREDGPPHWSLERLVVVQRACTRQPRRDHARCGATRSRHLTRRPAALAEGMIRGRQALGSGLPRKPIVPRKFFYQDPIPRRLRAFGAKR